MKDFIEYVEHREYGLAIEILSDWIYEHDVETSVDQQEAFVRVSERYGVDPSYHAFLGRQPPYADLRTPQHLAEEELLHTPSLDTVRHLVRTGRKLMAIRMYREVTGASLDQTIAAVDRMV